MLRNHIINKTKFEHTLEMVPYILLKHLFLQEQGALVSDQCGYYIMNERDSIDIDTEYDFLLANFFS